ncbi:MAG: hypothetical protein FJ291_05700 [Planctomycetes bacterium]|nr:hypothetical protein [Planctomycetota bacterium]
MPPDEPCTPTEQDLLKSLRKKLARRAGGTGVPPVGDTGKMPVPPTPASHAIVYRRDLPLDAPRRPAAPGPGICIPIEKCIEGRETPCSGAPPFYLIEGPATGNQALAEALAEALPRAFAAIPLVESPPLAPRDACFLDIETTGLGTATVFLIGTLLWRDGRIVCRQLLARSYAEEASILAAFAEDARSARILVTFNGKTFDVPSLRARAAAARVALPEVPLHFDLLHAARRRYSEALPDCRLVTLERCVCGRHRVGDIAGADIGRAYHDFVRTGDARELALIVQHNRADLLTLAELMARMLLTRDP